MSMTASEVVNLITNMIGTIALINLIAIVVQLGKEFSKIRGENNKYLRIISIGILGGLFGIYCTFTAYNLDGSYISLRDIGPMMSGLLAGPLAGFIAGFMAGLTRLLYGLVKDGIMAGTTIPCSIATLVIGVATGFVYKFFRPKKHKLIFAFCLGVIMEIFHLFFIFLYLIPSKGALDSFNFVLKISLPFLLTNGIGFLILVYVLNFIRKQRETELEKKQIQNELNTATDIQKSMLPIIFPEFPGRKEIDISAIMHPAKEVGGDFYDFFFIDNDHFCFLVGDVSGKGVPAALFMVIAKTLLQVNLKNASSMKEAIEKTNNELMEDNSSNMFVTCWIGVLEFSTGLLKYVNCGHNPPLIKKYNNEFQYLKNRSGIVLSGRKNSKYKEFQTYLFPSDKIFLYTDGITEAMDTKMNEFGEDNFIKALKEIDVKKSAQDSIKIIENDVKEFAKGAEQSDDITMLVLSMQGNTSYKELRVNKENFDEFEDFIDEEFRNNNIDISLTNKIKIVFDEIYSNLVKYSKATMLTLGISFFEKELSIIFKYDGDNFDITKESDPDITLSSKDREIGGLGLFIVKKTMDKVIYNRIDNQNIIVLKKGYE